MNPTFDPNRFIYESPSVGPQGTAYVESAITRALRDPVGLRDFALLADGARLIPELTFPSRERVGGRLPRATSPEIALVDDLHVGNCWSFAGERSQLGLRLSEIIYPTYVTVDHIPAEIAADAGNAPRSMVLWGAVDGMANENRLQQLRDTVPALAPGSRVTPPVSHGYKYVPLVSFEYDIWAPSHVQTFRVDQWIKDSRMDFGVMILEIAGNWGGNGTCLYRVRIHGQPI
ncbi:hypothetical protein C8Q73DRAFT_745131 [Cubamyces lactineus]|nr:hypothetical protein C8Q73DRAFT_745131 [Cubamyces lactineus]